MSEPPATAQPPPRRPSVGVGVLLAVIAGAFAWGLLMYSFGAASHGAGPADDPAEAALSQLSRIDQALGADDPESARAQLAQLATPAGPAWAAARALRERAANAAAARAGERAIARDRARHLDQRLQALAPGLAAMLDLGACAHAGGDLLALAYGGAHGIELRASRDGGAHWSALAPALPGRPLRLVHQAPAALMLVIACAEGSGLLAWSTQDGRSFSPVQLPARAAGELSGPWAVGGDGALVAGVRVDGAELCLRSTDAGASWQAGTAQPALLRIVPTATGTLAIARGPGDALRLSSDGGASWHEAEAELAALIPAGASPSLFAIGGSCLVVGRDGARRLDAGGRLLAAPVTLPGMVAPEAIIAHPQLAQRWYALHDHGLWRSDDGGGHWRRGSGRLGELQGRCLEFAPGERPRLLIGGDAVWSLDDEDGPLLFDEALQP